MQHDWQDCVLTAQFEVHPRKKWLFMHELVFYVRAADADEFTEVLFGEINPFQINPIRYIIILHTYAF